jgi:hypothetical protein
VRVPADLDVDLERSHRSLRSGSGIGDAVDWLIPLGQHRGACRLTPELSGGQGPESSRWFTE